MRKMIKNQGEVFELDTERDTKIFSVDEDPSRGILGFVVYQGQSRNLRYRVFGEGQAVAFETLTKEQVEDILIEHNAPIDAFVRNETNILRA